MSSNTISNPADYHLRSKRSLTPDAKNKIAKEKSQEERERSNTRRLNQAQKQDQQAPSPSKSKERPQSEKGAKTLAPATEKAERRTQKSDSEKAGKQQQQQQQPTTTAPGEKPEDQEKKKKQTSAGESYISIFSEYTSKSGPSIRENWEGVKTYTLYEDLKILCEVAKDRSHEGLGPKFWKNVEEKKEIRRSVESMRDRYKRFLRFLGKAEFDRIVAYLKKHGIKGFLHFEKDPNTSNVRILKKISEEDPNIVASKTNIEKANKSENRRRDPSVPRIRTKPVKQRTTTIPSALGPIEIRSPLVGFGPKVKAKLAAAANQESAASMIEEESITMGSLKRLEKIVQQKIGNNKESNNNNSGNNSNSLAQSSGLNNSEINQSNSGINNNDSSLRLQIPSVNASLARKQHQQQQPQQQPQQGPFLTVNSVNNNNNNNNNKRKAPIQYEEIYDYERAPEKRIYGGGPRADPFRGRYEPPIYEHRYGGYHPGPTARSPYYSGYGNSSSAYYQPHRPSPYKYSAEKKRSISKDMGATVGDLNQVLDVFEKMFNLPKETIIEEFIAVSGDTKDLYELLDGRNENLRWTPEEDELLENLRGVEDPQFRILARYKGVDRMRKRVEFRKLDFEFEF